MNTELNNYTILIGEDQYTIVSDEGAVAVEKLAQKVNCALTEIMTKTESSDVKRCSILVAIKFAHQLQKLECELQEKNNKESLLIEQINQQISGLIS